MQCRCLYARLKFRTVTGTRGFFGKLFLYVCLHVPVCVLIFLINLVLILVFVCVLIFVFVLVLITVIKVKRVETQNIVINEQERCCFSGASLVTTL